MLYTTNQISRHWYFNFSFKYYSDNFFIKKISIFELFNLIYFQQKKVILLDFNLFQKLLFLFLGIKNLFIVIHGELGYKFVNNVKYKLYYFIFIKLVKFSKCKKILLSRYLSSFFFDHTFIIIEHPGMFISTQKKRESNELLSFGALSNDKISLSTLKKLDQILFENNCFIHHSGNNYINFIFKNIFFNGFASDKKILSDFSSNKYIFLLNNSSYNNIVSGIVIQSIVNKCLIVTFENYPDLIKYYEKTFNVILHLDIREYLSISNKDNFYEKCEYHLEIAKNSLINFSYNDFKNLFTQLDYDIN